MKKFLFIYAVLVTAVLFFGAKYLLNERSRLKGNQSALAQQIEHYRTRLGEESASVQILRLRCGEYEELRAADAEKVRSLGIRLRRAEAAAKSVTSTGLLLKAPVKDTVINRFEPVGDAIIGQERVQTFRWRDAWVSVEGMIRADSVECRVHSVDTLYQVVHRVPRRFLGIPVGTRAIRQQIHSSNPHTHIVYSEYVSFEKGLRRKW